LHERDHWARSDHAHEINVHGALPLVDSRREKALGRWPPAFALDVGAAEFLHHGVTNADSGRVGHIERFSKDFAWYWLRILSAAVFEGFAIARAHGDAAAFGGEGFGCGPPS
jgi:hypothetical protein